MSRKIFPILFILNAFTVSVNLYAQEEENVTTTNGFPLPISCTQKRFKPHGISFLDEKPPFGQSEEEQKRFSASLDETIPSLKNRQPLDANSSFQQTLKFICKPEDGESNPTFFFTKKSGWGKKSEFVRVALNPNSQGAKERSVKVSFLKKSAVETIDEMIDMSTEEKIKKIYDWKISNLIWYIKKFHELQFSPESTYNELIELLVYKLRDASEEEISSNLQELDSLPENIDTFIKNELLEITPEFYSTLVYHPRYEAMREKQLSPNLVLKEYCHFLQESPCPSHKPHENDCIKGNCMFSFCFAKNGEFIFLKDNKGLLFRPKHKKIEQLSDHLLLIIDTDEGCYTRFIFNFNTEKVVIQFGNSLSIKANNILVVQDDKREKLLLFDIQKEEIIQELPSKKNTEIFKVNDDVIGMEPPPDPAEDSILYDIKQKKEIKRFSNVRAMTRLNQSMVAIIDYFSDLQIYNVSNGEITKLSKNTLGNRKVRYVISINNTIMAIVFAGSPNQNHLKLYDLEKNKPIKTFEKIRSLNRLNDFRIEINYQNGNVIIYDLEKKKIIWKGEKGEHTSLLGKNFLVTSTSFFPSVTSPAGFLTSSDYVTYLLKVFDLRKEGQDQLIFQTPCKNYKIRGNNLFLLMKDATIKRLGPGLYLNKLNTKQLLSLIVTMRKNPQKIAWVLTEKTEVLLGTEGSPSTAVDRRKNQVKSAKIEKTSVKSTKHPSPSQFKSWLQKKSLFIGITLLASYFFYAKYFKHYWPWSSTITYSI